MGLKLYAFINPICGLIGSTCPDIFKGMTFVRKCVGIWECIVNLIYWCGVQTRPDINPIHYILWVGNVSYVDVGFV